MCGTVSPRRAIGVCAIVFLLSSVATAQGAAPRSHTRAILNESYYNHALLDLIPGGRLFRKMHMEIVMGDVRAELGRIQTPALVLASPAGDGATADREGVERLFRLQFANMKAWDLEIAPRARHFIMYDEPAWMFEKMDAFLGR